MFLFIICPAIGKGSDVNCVKLWTFFCKFYLLSIKSSYAAPFSLLKLLQSWFHPSASSVFDPVKFKARFLFCDCLSLLFIDTPLSLLQCFSSSKFSPSLSSWPKTLRAFEVLQVGRFLLPLSLLKYFLSQT